MNRARRWLSLVAWTVSNTLASLAIRLDPEQDQIDREVERVRSVMLRAVESHRRECMKPDPNVN
jgi:hypothetical protein